MGEKMLKTAKTEEDGRFGKKRQTYNSAHQKKSYVLIRSQISSFSVEIV